jgi:septation ring formation regulator EzrA
VEVLTKQSVANSAIMGELSELHALREKIRVFEAKYRLSLEQFERDLEEHEEDFQKFDDYIDWKGSVKAAHELEKRIEELRRGHFAVA